MIKVRCDVHKRVTLPGDSPGAYVNWSEQTSGKPKHEQRGFQWRVEYHKFPIQAESLDGLVEEIKQAAKLVHDRKPEGVEVVRLECHVQIGNTSIRIVSDYPEA